LESQVASGPGRHAVRVKRRPRQLELRQNNFHIRVELRRVARSARGALAAVPPSSPGARPIALVGDNATAALSLSPDML